MVELTCEQARALIGFMSSTRSILSKIESASGPFCAARDIAIEDCQNWIRILLEKQRDVNENGPISGAAPGVERAVPPMTSKGALPLIPQPCADRTPPRAEDQTSGDSNG